jgi:hypothetical protein
VPNPLLMQTGHAIDGFLLHPGLARVCRLRSDLPHRIGDEAEREVYIVGKAKDGRRAGLKLAWWRREPAGGGPPRLQQSNSGTRFKRFSRHQFGKEYNRCTERIRA